MAGLDWKVLQLPVSVNITPGYQVSSRNHVANVRDTDHRVLGVVSKRYAPVQNDEAFKFVDILLDHGDVRLETAGSLHGGQIVWLLARLKRADRVCGDELATYLLFANGHNGQFSVKVLITPVRVVCANTLNLALKGSTRTWTTTHVGDIKGRVEDARYTLGLAHDYMDLLVKAAKELLSIRVSDDQLRTVVNTLIPMPDNAGPTRRRNVSILRGDLLTRRFAPDLRGMESTGWAVVNAVADHVAHVPRLRAEAEHDPGKTEAASESRFYSIVTGHAMLDKAYTMVTHLGV